MEKHFELTDQTLWFGGETLYRIRATQDLPAHGVRKGDLGGWVRSVENLVDRAWVGGEARVSDNARVGDNARVYDKAIVCNESQVFGNAQVYGNARVYGRSHVGGDSQVYDNGFLQGQPVLGGEGRVYGNGYMMGNSYLSERAQVYGDARMWGKSSMYENSRLAGTATLGGDASLYGSCLLAGDASLSGNASVNDTGEVLSELHVLSGDFHTSVHLDWVLHRLRGGGHVLHVGCESGDLDHHQALCDSDTWIETIDPEVIAARPEYQAVIDLCRARVARWGEIQ